MSVSLGNRLNKLSDLGILSRATSEDLTLRRRYKMGQEKQRHVVPSPEGGWDIKKPHAERSSEHFDTKQDAVDRAREISKNIRGELIIHNRDGIISRRDSHGNDPCPPKDKK